jgi:hypothetical protein
MLLIFTFFTGQDPGLSESILRFQNLFAERLCWYDFPKFFLDYQVADFLKLTASILALYKETTSVVDSCYQSEKLFKPSYIVEY